MAEEGQSRIGVCGGASPAQRLWLWLQQLCMRSGSCACERSCWFIVTLVDLWIYAAPELKKGGGGMVGSVLHHPSLGMVVGRSEAHEHCKKDGKLGPNMGPVTDVPFPDPGPLLLVTSVTPLPLGASHFPPSPGHGVAVPRWCGGWGGACRSMNRHCRYLPPASLSEEQKCWFSEKHETERAMVTLLHSRSGPPRSARSRGGERSHPPPPRQDGMPATAGCSTARACRNGGHLSPHPPEVLTQARPQL